MTSYESDITTQLKQEAIAVHQMIAERWRSGRLYWKLHSGQKPIYKILRNLDPAVRKRVVLNSRRYGKSFLGVVMAIEDCLAPPWDEPVRIIGPEIKQTVDIIEPIINKISVDAPDGLIRRIKSEYRWQVGESQLILGGFDRKNIERHRGQPSKSIYIEEAGSSNPADYDYGMKEVLLPQLLHSGGPMTFLTTPPTDPMHPFVVETITEAKINKSFFTRTIYDNPMLSEEQIDTAIGDCGGIDTPAFRREYLCEIFRDESTVIIPQFDKHAHVQPLKAPEHASWLMGGDFGGVRDKTVFLLSYWDYERAKMCVVGERVFGPGTPTSKIIEGARSLEALAELKSEPIRYIDMPGQVQVDINEAHGYYAAMPIKDDFDAAINQLALAFGQNKILVDPSCEFLVASLESGRFNKNRTDFMRSEALGHCDAIAALMYSWRMIDKVTNPFPRQIYDTENQFVNPLSRHEKRGLEIVAEIFAQKQWRR